MSTVPSSGGGLFPEGCHDCELPWLLSSSESDKLCSVLLEECPVSAGSCDLGCMPGVSIALRCILEGTAPAVDSPEQQKCPSPSGSVYFDHKLLSGSIAGAN